MIVYTDKHHIPFEIDDEDYERVKTKIWHVAKGYVRSTQGETIRLHEFLMGKAPENLEWDHIDRNKFNNHKWNLRLVSHSINMRNLNVKSNSSSGYQGVYKRKSGRFCVMIHVNKQPIHVGEFESLEEAVHARKQAELQYWG